MRRSRRNICGECGAELVLGATCCPLCGADAAPTEPKSARVADVDNYQSNVRELREQLKRLRDDHPEAV